jgi:FkbM family methyltransferase
MMKSLLSLHRFFSSHPLTRTVPLGAWTRFAAWQIKSRLNREVVVPWVGGQRLAVRRGMTGATGNIYVGLHEFSDMMFLLHILRADDLFLDIGANVGTYSVLASGVCGARSWAFEPDPNTAAHLFRNIEINSLQQLVEVHQMALGPESGEVRFTVGLDTVNRVAGASDGEFRRVPQRTLDEIVAGHDPILIKMDVEGYEEEVFAGSRRALEKPSLKAIEIETVTPAMHDALSANNFQRVYYDPFRRALSADPSDGATNSLFVRDIELVRSRLAAARPVVVLGHLI